MKAQGLEPNWKQYGLNIGEVIGDVVILYYSELHPRLLQGQST